MAANPNLADTVLTLDAIHCNPESCGEICEDAHANYLIGVKKNQKELLKDLELIFAASLQSADTFDCEGKGHGREEIRRVELLPVKNQLKFPHARTAIRVYRQRTPVRNGQREETKLETAYFLTSLDTEEDNLSAQKAAELVRNHWSAIENGLHYIKDASLLEDRYRANNGLARILSAMRSLAVLIFRPLKYTTLNAMTKMAGNIHHAIHFLTYRSLDKARTEFLQ